jgi:hypothetical protein
LRIRSARISDKIRFSLYIYLGDYKRIFQFNSPESETSYGSRVLRNLKKEYNDMLGTLLSWVWCGAYT